MDETTLAAKRKYNNAQWHWEKLGLQVQMGHIKEANDALKTFQEVLLDLQKILESSTT